MARSRKKDNKERYQVRETYCLTNETRQALANNVQATAQVLGKNDSYLYAILAERQTDPFAPFMRLFEGVAGGPEPERCQHWLKALYGRYLRGKYGVRGQVSRGELVAALVRETGRLAELQLQNKLTAAQATQAASEIAALAHQLGASGTEQ